MKRQLHIGYLIQDFPPEVGAGPARVTEMATRWQERGARVSVITGMPNRRIPGRGEGRIDPEYRGKLFLEEQWEGIRTLRSWVFANESLGFGSKLVNNVSFMASGFAHALRKAGRPDVLIASSPPFLSLVSGVALAKIWRVPLVVEIRDLWPDYLVQMGLVTNSVAQRTLFALERWLLRRASHVVVVTDSFKTRVAGKGVSLDHISVIPNGVDLERYHPMPRESAREALDDVLPRDDVFLVGYLGTFGRGQALLQVVRAAESLRDTDPSIHFLLVGDGPERELLAAAIRDRALRNVSMVPPLARERTLAFYNACDVCLVPLAPIPIFSESIPSKIFEVMACGRPMVASVSGEAAAIVERSGSGMRVDPGDGDALARAVVALRRVPTTEREATARRTREHVAAHFNRRDLADEYLGLLLAL